MSDRGTPLADRGARGSVTVLEENVGHENGQIGVHPVGDIELNGAAEIAYIQVPGQPLLGKNAIPSRRPIELQPCRLPGDSRVAGQLTRNGDNIFPDARSQGARNYLGVENPAEL